MCSTFLKKLPTKDCRVPSKSIHLVALSQRQKTYLTILKNPFQCLIQMLLIPVAISYNIISDLWEKENNDKYLGKGKQIEVKIPMERSKIYVW